MWRFLGRVGSLQVPGVGAAEGGSTCVDVLGENASPPRCITAHLLLMLGVFLRVEISPFPPFSHAVSGGLSDGDRVGVVPPQV